MALLCGVYFLLSLTKVGLWSGSPGIQDFLRPNLVGALQHWCGLPPPPPSEPSLLSCPSRPVWSAAPAAISHPLSKFLTIKSIIFAIFSLFERLSWAAPLEAIQLQPSLADPLAFLGHSSEIHLPVHPRCHAKTQAPEGPSGHLGFSQAPPTTANEKHSTASFFHPSWHVRSPAQEKALSPCRCHWPLWSRVRHCTSTFTHTYIYIYTLTNFSILYIKINVF